MAAAEETVARKMIGRFERPEMNDGHFCKIWKFRSVSLQRSFAPIMTLYLYIYIYLK